MHPCSSNCCDRIAQGPLPQQGNRGRFIVLFRIFLINQDYKPVLTKSIRLVMKTIYKILFVALFSFMIGPAFGQKLNGKVKSYKDCYYSLHEVFGKIKKGARLNDSIFRDQHVSFDKNGNIALAIEYNPNGTVNSRFTGMGDYANNHIESIFVRFDTEMKIDKKPFILKTVNYPSGELCELTYKNDTSGLPVEQTIFDLMGRALFKITIKRDEKGNALEYNFSDGNVDQYKYDNDGNRVEWISRTASGHTTVTFYKHDLSGNIVDESINDNFKSSYKYHYEHNTYKYAFDKQGNWVERTDYEHDIPQRIVIRTIEYSK